MNKIVILLMLSLVAVADKVMVLDFYYDNGHISIMDKEVLVGYYPDRIFQPENGYEMRVISTSGEELYSFRFVVPLVEYTDSVQGELITGAAIVRNSTRFSLTIPDFSDASRIEFYNERSYKVADLPLDEERLAPKGVFAFGFVIGAIILVLVIKKFIKKS